jgi:hypothetical protein
MRQLDGRRDELYRSWTRESLPPARGMSIHSPTWQDLDDTPSIYQISFFFNRLGRATSPADPGRKETAAAAAKQTGTVIV